MKHRFRLTALAWPWELRAAWMRHLTYVPAPQPREDKVIARRNREGPLHSNDWRRKVTALRWVTFLVGLSAIGLCLAVVATTGDWWASAFYILVAAFIGKLLYELEGRDA